MVKFVRERDYEMKCDLGSGSTGKTVLLFDDQIDEHFVCKKYAPQWKTQQKELYENFVREIKLLHRVFHENVVRVFNYYLYPAQYVGYILMEYVDGPDVEEYIEQHPENINDVFLQVVEGFAYLAERAILHRDIRPQNILVGQDSKVKIIDLGFGKRIEISGDFDKSVALNWWCETPAEFSEKRYDFRTEVYFVGKLFQKLIENNGILHFKYPLVLGEMCDHEPEKRVGTFEEVRRRIRNDKFPEFEFSDSERKAYQVFVEQVCDCLVTIDRTAKFQTDEEIAVRKLEAVYRSGMLSEFVPRVVLVLACFINGTFSYRRDGQIEVSALKSFLSLFSQVTEERRGIVFANLYTRLGGIERTTRKEPPPIDEDQVPF